MTPFGRRRFGNRPLWGAAQIEFTHMTVPVGADPASRDPDHPGILLHTSGSLELGVWRGNDGSAVYLSIESVVPSGFAGKWSSDLGIMTLIHDGRRLPNPRGHFCAIRR
jgi:hypothetical protein